MAAGQQSQSQFAAQLVEGCLAHIAGRPQRELPVAPVTVTALERASVGLTGVGQTLMYPIGGTGVFVDLSGSVATVWFLGGDYELGLERLESMLKASHRPKQLKDEALAEPRQRARSFEIDLGGGRLAHVVAEYAERGAHRERFLVRVGAQVRKN